MELGKPSVSEHPSIFDEAWREVRIYPTITGVSAYFNDITERKRAEEELKRLSAEAQRRNRVLTGAKKILSAALGSVSEEELGRLCLSVAEEITDSGFGFIGEVNGEGLYDIALSDPGWQACTMTDQSGHRAPLEFKLHGLYGEVVTSGRSLLTNAPAQHPASIGTPPGHPPLSAFLGAPLRSGDRVIGLIGVGNREGGYRDTDRESLEELTEALVQAFERRRAEQMLREHEERFRLLHDTMLQGVVYQEADGAIISMNAAAERILGKGPQDFLGLSSVAVEHDTLREDGSPFPGLEHPAMVALRTGQPVPGVIMQVYNPREARYRVIDIQAVPLFRPGEADPYRVYAVFDDVTEAKQAERERRQLLEQARSQAEEVWAQSEELRAQRDTIVRELESTSLLLEAAETSAKTAPLSDVLDQLARVVLRLSGHSRATFSSWHEEPRRMEVVHSAARTRCRPDSPSSRRHVGRRQAAVTEATYAGRLRRAGAGSSRPGRESDLALRAPRPAVRPEPPDRLPGSRRSSRTARVQRP